QAQLTLEAQPVNDPPISSGEYNVMDLAQDGMLELDLDDLFDDMDSELSYHVSSDDLSFAINGSILTIIPRDGYVGIGYLQVTASDEETEVNATISVRVLENAAGGEIAPAAASAPPGAYLAMAFGALIAVAAVALAVSELKHRRSDKDMLSHVDEISLQPA
ncbi:MAG: hypothetical protein KAT70_01255, partial [Thermoplasmata archaeon]|nr:hypothetical protein [Thermoplasmata archaeon]